MCVHTRWQLLSFRAKWPSSAIWVMAMARIRCPILFIWIGMKEHLSPGETPTLQCVLSGKNKGSKWKYRFLSTDCTESACLYNSRSSFNECGNHQAWTHTGFRGGAQSCHMWCHYFGQFESDLLMTKQRWDEWKLAQITQSKKKSAHTARIRFLAQQCARSSA